jgi:hypothetical protein
VFTTARRTLAGAGVILLSLLPGGCDERRVSPDPRRSFRWMAPWIR